MNRRNLLQSLFALPLLPAVEATPSSATITFNLIKDGVIIKDKVIEVYHNGILRVRMGQW